jgi:hypothetical protein
VTQSEEREARNESVFRDANEKLRQTRDLLAVADDQTPFLCECQDERCTTMILLTLEEYERARRSGDFFLVAPDHEDRTDGKVISRGERYVLVQKAGRAGEVARGLDPRAS